MRKRFFPAALVIALAAVAPASAQNLGANNQIANLSNTPITQTMVQPRSDPGFHIADFFHHFSGISNKRTIGRSYLPTGTDYMKSFGMARPTPFGQ